MWPRFWAICALAGCAALLLTGRNKSIAAPAAVFAGSANHVVSSGSNSAAERMGGHPEWLPEELSVPDWSPPAIEPEHLKSEAALIVPPQTVLPPTAVTPPAKSLVAPENNPNKWDVKLGGHVQLDFVSWLNADEKIGGTPGPQDYFEFRRLRLLADGKGYENCDFRLQMTLEPETVGATPGVTSPDVKDAYFSMNEIPGLGRFRIGNFFVPFGLEQVTNDTNNIFLERSIPSQGIFTVDREVGVALYNCSDNERLGWATGVFFDSISEGLKERIDDNEGARFSGRVTWLPFYDERSKGRWLIHTGAGILHTLDQDGRVRFRSRPQIHEGPALIDSGVIQADNYTTANLELAAVLGSVSLQSEAFLSAVNQTNGPIKHIGGVYAHLSWFLTGEHRRYEQFGQHGAQFGRNVPKQNFKLARGRSTPGAWELKSRFSHLNLDRFDKGQYNDLTTGLNWYWTDRTRVMADWIHPVTTRAATFGGTESDLLALRFDFNW